MVRIVVVLIAILLNPLVTYVGTRVAFVNFRMDGNSMLPTIEDGAFTIVNKLEIRLNGADRSEIVVFSDPRRPETDLVKRVIGLPGETVEIVDGRVFINDMVLDEPYITTPWNDTKSKILIPNGEYYVLGDNRDNSLDSRSSQVGLVPEDLIIGRASFVYWPWEKADKGTVSLWVAVLTLPTIVVIGATVALLRRRGRSVWWAALILAPGLGGTGLAIIYFWVKPLIATPADAPRLDSTEP